MSQHHTHKLIKSTAVELAGAYYEVAAKDDNRFYAKFRNQKAFMAREWANFVPTARLVLTDMLAKPSVSEMVKEGIYEALINDRSIGGTNRGSGGKFLRSFN